MVAIPLLVLLSLLRVGGTGALDTVWAEDGELFYQQSLRTGPLRLLIEPYNGYLHLVPRLVVDFALLFPAEDLAAVLAGTGALISSSLAVFVFRASRVHLRSRLLQATVAAPLALTWVAQSEIGNNVADAQWYLLYAAFWAALHPGRSVRSQVSAAAVLFLAAGSDPFTALYFPLLRRQRYQSIGMIAGLAYQGIGIVFTGALSSRAADRSYNVFRSGDAYLVHVVGHALWPASGQWPIGAAVALALVARTTRRLPSSRADVAKAAFAYSILIYCALTMSCGVVANRYAYPAAALFLAGLASSSAGSGRGQKMLAGAVAVSVGWGWCGGPDTSLRAHSPSWRAELRLAAARCQDSHATDVDVTIAPTTWKVRLPCTLLLRDSAAGDTLRAGSSSTWPPRISSLSGTPLLGTRLEPCR